MFDEMVSEKLIEWIWILASIGVVIFGLLMMFAGGGFVGFLMAAMYIVIGLLVTRVVCEAMIVIFKMHENLQWSARSLEKLQASLTNAPGRAVPQASTAYQVQSQAKPVSAPPAQSVASTTPSNVGSEEPATGDATPGAMKKDDYHDRMMAIRERLEQEARDKRRY